MTVIVCHDIEKNLDFSILENDAFRAMEFAMYIHKDQKRKYTGNPYFTHLAEVAGLVSTVHQSIDVIATAWLHDCMEDCGVEFSFLEQKFNFLIAKGVFLLSDLETGNRKERKRASRERLSEAPAWIQDIKVCDLISNTSSIALHDPKFAVTYLEEKKLLLDVLTEANPNLLKIAYAMMEGNNDR